MPWSDRLHGGSEGSSRGLFACGGALVYYADSMRRLPPELIERVLSRHPLPVADAVAGLAAAESLHEQRDRVVEVFRAVVRTVAGMVLAARVQYGPGPGNTPPQVPDLLRNLRRKGLTDGQWVGLVRELLRPWKAAPEAHALPGVVALFHGRGATVSKVLDGLLAMRKAQTVAHGTAGDPKELVAVLAERLPQLQVLIEAFEPLWEQFRLVVPLAPSTHEGERQRAWALYGDTPGRGRWRRIDLALGTDAPAGEAVLIDRSGRPVVALHPVVQVRRPLPDAVEECFFLDGGTKRGARFVAIPSMAELFEAEVWRGLESVLQEGEEADESVFSGRPFLGLSSFGPEHRDRFFGRDAMAEGLVNRIRRFPMVTVTGPSGCGKTSLLQAGVLPRLLGHEQVILRPGAKPVAALARALGSRVPLLEDGTDLPTAIRRNPTVLGPGMAQWCRASGRGLIVVVDQAEELLTLCTDAEEQQAFAGALASAAEDPDGPVRVVLSLREDFFGRLATLAPLRGVYSRQVEVVTTPDRDSLVQTLLGPLAATGHTFESPELVETMVAAVEGESAALALLQFCADRLWDARDRTWKRLTWDAYRSVGGVEGALASHADRVMDELTPLQREEARGLLLRLVTAENTRAVCTRNELREVALDPAAATVVLDRLVEARLLVVRESDAPGQEGRVELVHEALIRHWHRLNQWLSDDREGLRTLLALRTATREWDARGRPKGLLWRGEVLEEYRVFRRHSHARLTKAEAAFGAASHAEAERETRLRRRLVVSAIAVLVLFAGIMWTQWRTAQHERDAAMAAEAEAKTQGLRAKVRLLQARAGQEEVNGGHLESAVLLRSALHMAMNDMLLSELRTDLDVPVRSRIKTLAQVLQTDGEQAGSAVLSPDGRTLATASKNNVEVGSRSESVELWDANSGRPIGVLGGHQWPVTSIVFGPDGKTIATASKNESIVNVWNLTTGIIAHRLEGHSDGITALVYAQEGRSLVSGSRDGTVRIWDMDGGSHRFTLDGHSDAVLSLSASPDGSTVVSGAANSTAFVWDVQTGSVLHELGGHTAGIFSVAYSPSGDHVATLAYNDDARVWESATGELQFTLADPSSRIRTLRFSPDGQILAAGAKEATTSLWETSSGRLVRTLRGSAPAFSSDGTVIATVETGTLHILSTETGGAFGSSTGGYSHGLFFDEHAQRFVAAGIGGTVLLFSMDDLSPPAVLSGHPGFSSGLALSPDGEKLVSGAEDGSVRVWSMSTGVLEQVMPGSGAYVSRIAIAPDNQSVAAIYREPLSISSSISLGASEANGTDEAVESAKQDAHVEWSVRVWPMADLSRSWTLTGHTDAVTALAYAPDGERLATVSEDSTGRIWDAKTGQMVWVLSGHEEALSAVVFSPDGRWISTSSYDGTIRIWDNNTGSLERALDTGTDAVLDTAFSPDGFWVAAASSDGTVRIWSREAGSRPMVLEGHEAAVQIVRFSPDGQRLATAAGDRSARIWDVGTGRPLHEWDDAVAASPSIAFSPDGKTLTTNGNEQNALVWDVETGMLRQTLSGHAATVFDVAYGPKGGLATTSSDSSVIIWDTRIANLSQAELLTEIGRRTNLRVCRDTLKVVPLLPFPAPETIWVEDVLDEEKAAARCAR